MNKDEVIKLSKLARVEISEAEAEKLSHEFDAILSYVAEVKNVLSGKTEPAKEDFPLRNVMRSDDEVHESGIYTDKILKEAPASENGLIKVKKIL